MRCQVCDGFVDPMPHYTDNGTRIEQRRCIMCCRITFIKNDEEMKPDPIRKTGRGKDNHKRQGYGKNKEIMAMPHEEWQLPNDALADRHGVSPTWIAQLRKQCGELIRERRFKSHASKGC